MDPRFKALSMLLPELWMQLPVLNNSCQPHNLENANVIVNSLNFILSNPLVYLHNLITITTDIF